MTEFRLPAISGQTDHMQLEEIKRYLFTLSQELNLALGQVERKQEQVLNAAPARTKGLEKSPAAQFSQIKSLIIKSADIVDAYYERIAELLKTSGEYAAASDFGTYRESVTQQLGAEHDRITQSIDRISEVSDTADNAYDAVLTQRSYLRYGTVGTTLDETGMAADTAPGIEIGDYQDLDSGSLTNRRFARFTAYGLELFGSSLDAGPVAYIRQNKLYITDAEITHSLRVGGYVISKSDGLSFDWVGG